MSITKKEIQNYLFFSLSNIKLLFEATLLAIQILYRKILRFIGNSKFNNYPKRAIDLSKINLYLINNNFQQTKPINFKSNLITPLINLDFDLYYPSKVALEKSWPVLSKGGIIILDNYKIFDGETKAVNEFLKKNKLSKQLKKVKIYRTFYYLQK